MTIKRIYISGKISGLPIKEVISKFQAACDKLRRFGLEPMNPLNNGLPLDADWADQMGKDISILLRCDAITCYLIIRIAMGQRLSWQWLDSDRCPYLSMQLLNPKIALQRHKYYE